MVLRSAFLSIFLLTIAVGGALAQNADNTTSLFPQRDPREDQPKSIKEQLDKLRIEQEKKDHQAMLVRGDEALKISEELDTKVSTNAQLDTKDRQKLESLEKILKKIRNELGGDDDGGSALDPAADQSESDEVKPNERPKDVVDGIKSLRSTTIKLVDELKKTTRFTISATAIQTTNAVLRITRILKFWN
ncbi:MAG: hypothetical protein KA956_05870 [Pyrinomonadaceae bacterium]|nr:hypothetical protein [Acidobacteriota bacterium]MBP7375985.1 hypothetical protein [Pyrinomonadaceae bacterium]